jgi:Fur family ferric uptake transcriptional regulator
MQGKAVQSGNARRGDWATQSPHSGHHGRSDPGEELRRYMHERGLKQTAQRELILEVFLDMGGHPSPEELHEAVRLKDGTIGLATIYRTLKLLADSGVAREEFFGDGVTRYELRHGKQQHIHLICERCGKNIEVQAEDIERHYRALSQDRGFKLVRYCTCLYGLCEQCAGKVDFSYR